MINFTTQLENNKSAHDKIQEYVENWGATEYTQIQIKGTQEELEQLIHLSGEFKVSVMLGTFICKPDTINSSYFTDTESGEPMLKLFFVGHIQ